MFETIKNKLTRNIGMKLISIIIAIVLWVMINSLIDPVKIVTIKDVPVTLKNVEEMVSAGQLIEIEAGDKVNIKVRAKRSIADTLSARDFAAVADVTNINEFNSVSIAVTCPDYTDSEVELISYSTDDGTTMLHLSLEEVKAQNYAVDVIYDGAVANGYYIFSTTMSPNLITIKGTDKQLSKIAKVAVIAKVEGVSGDISTSYSIVLYDKEGSTVATDNLFLSESRVKVEMKLAKTKEIPLVVKLAGNPADGYVCDSFEYAPHYITIAGDSSVLAKIDSLPVEVNISDAKTNVQTEFNIAELVKEIYGDEVKVVNESQKVSVVAYVEAIQEKTLTVSTKDIDMRGLDPKFAVEFAEEEFKLTVKAKASALENIAASTIKTYINCSGFTKEGKYDSVLVSVEQIDGVKTSIVTIALKLVPAGREATRDE